MLKSCSWSQTLKSNVLSLSQLQDLVETKKKIADAIFNIISSLITCFLLNKHWTWMLTHTCGYIKCTGDCVSSSIGHTYKGLSQSMNMCLQSAIRHIFPVNTCVEMSLSLCLLHY